MKSLVLPIYLFGLFTFTSCIFGMHNEPYETIPLEGVNFCAFRYDCEYYKLHYYDENSAQELVVWDFLQSVLYGENVLITRCALKSDFFVRYYFVTFDSIKCLESHNPFDPTRYNVYGPISEQACLDSLRVRNIDLSKMKIVNFRNYDYSEPRTDTPKENKPK